MYKNRVSRLSVTCEMSVAILNCYLQLYEFQNWKEHVLNNQNSNFHTNAVQGCDLMAIWILQKLEGLEWKWRNFPLQKPFPLVITTKGSCCHLIIGDRRSGIILGRMEYYIKANWTERQGFCGSLKTWTIPRICMENLWSVSGGQRLFQYKTLISNVIKIPS